MYYLEQLIAKLPLQLFLVFFAALGWLTGWLIGRRAARPKAVAGAGTAGAALGVLAWESLSAYDVTGLRWRPGWSFLAGLLVVSVVCVQSEGWATSRPN